MKRDVMNGSIDRDTASYTPEEEDLYLSMLGGYVEALGGRLEVNAVFPDETVTLVAAKP